MIHSVGYPKSPAPADVNFSGRRFTRHDFARHEQHMPIQLFEELESLACTIILQDCEAALVISSFVKLHRADGFRRGGDQADESDEADRQLVDLHCGLPRRSRIIELFGK